MNKRLLSLIASVVATVILIPVRAQYFTVGPEVGYERLNMFATGHDMSPDMTAKSGNGFRIGAVASYNFKSGVFLQASLSFSHRGGASIYNLTDPHRFPHVTDIDIRKMETLTLPVTAGYEFGIKGGWGIGIEAGGYLSSGIGNGSVLFYSADNEKNAGNLFGNSKFTHYNPETNDRESVEIVKSGRIDAGVVFGGHIRFNRLRLRASYQLGLNKTVYDIVDPRTFVLSLCYDFKL